jgi:hypothetical protein
MLKSILVPPPSGLENIDLLKFSKHARRKRPWSYRRCRYLHGDEFDQTFARVSYGEPRTLVSGCSGI